MSAITDLAIPICFDGRFDYNKTIRYENETTSDIYLSDYRAFYNSGVFIVQFSNLEF